MLKSIKVREFKELDTIRFISIFLVVLHHQFLSQNQILDWLGTYGWVGVDIFFVMSGFLITNLLKNEFQKTNDIKLKKFWLKRMIRLWPSWLFTQLISIPMIFYISRNDKFLRHELYSKFWHYLLHFGNYSHAYFGKLHTLYGQFWTLAVEEHFYLIWPLVLLLILKNKKMRFPALSVLILLPYLFRIFHLSHGDSYTVIKLSTHTRFDELIWGCALALYIDKIPSFNLKLELLLSLIMFFLFYLGLHILDYKNLPYYLSEFNFTVIGMGTVILLILATRGSSYGIRRLLQNNFLSKLGILSYGVYLIHMVTNTISFAIISKLAPDLNQNIIGLINFALPFIPAYFMYIYIDKKCEFLKTKLH